MENRLEFEWEETWILWLKPLPCKFQSLRVGAGQSVVGILLLIDTWAIAFFKERDRMRSLL
jgi:hypothetical protein